MILSRAKQLPSIAFAALVGTFVLLGNIDMGLEGKLTATSAALRRHAASGQVVLVEVDAASLARLHSWPWPRKLYADALDRLAVDGVRSVGFDIDFSAPSDAQSDRALAEALKRAGGSVYLPTFRQQGAFGGTNWIDSLPIPQLRDASFLAAVNVFPDADGIVNEYPLGVVTHGQPRPSIAAMVAETAMGGTTSFRIDYAIDPSTLPRISFADLLTGKVDPSRLRGKRVLIGATAIELGDRYAAPNYGVIPGVIIQALAAETLLQHGVPTHVSGVMPLLLALGILAAASLGKGRLRSFVAAGALALAFGGLIAAATQGVTLAIVPAIAAVVAFLMSECANGVLAELRRRRYVDPDSGLPNRPALEQAAGKEPAQVLTVAWLSNFHELATALGRDQSAQLIATIAARAKTLVGAEVYRIEEGGIGWIEPAHDQDHDRDGHFAALANLLRHTETVGGIAVDLRPAFGTATIGIIGVSEAVSGALIAAQRARAEGIRWRTFVADEGEQQRERLTLLGELSNALESGEIWVAYQPKFGLTERRVIGAEALVRWRHPTRGAIGPDAFIPLFEQEGRAFELTQFVLDRALADLASWRVRNDVGVAVNLSATLLDDPAMVPMIKTLLDHHGVEPSSVTIELTESAIMSESVEATQRLHDLRGLGVRLSIDDYGTGQSTLSYLRKVPANELKIDKSFVQAITTSSHDRLLVSSTLALAHALNLKVVAEGVEDQGTEAVLAELGCDIVQGWHTGRPVPCEAFVAILGSQDELAA